EGQPLFLKIVVQPLENRRGPVRGPYAAAGRCNHEHRHRLLVALVVLIELRCLVVPRERGLTNGGTIVDSRNWRPCLGRRRGAPFLRAEADTVKIAHQRGQRGGQKKKDNTLAWEFQGL